MKKSVRKMIWRTLWQTRTRFLAIFAITALGVGFLTGLLCTAPDMKSSVDRYYDAAHFMDIDIKSSGGLTEDDVREVANLSSVRSVTPVFQQEMVAENAEGLQHTIRITGVDFDRIHEDSVNLFTLTEGRLPQAKNECVQVKIGPFASLEGLGQQLILNPEEAEPVPVAETEETETEGTEAEKAGTDPAEEETEDEETEDDSDLSEDVNFELDAGEYEEEKEADLTEKVLTVVGIVTSPMMVSTDTETTSVGNGTISQYYYAPRELYDTTVYSDIYLTLEGTEEMFTFSDLYQDTVDGQIDVLKAMAPVRESVRYAEIQREAESRLAEGESEYQEKRAEAESRLAEAESEIAEAESEIADGESELADGKKELKDAKKELADAREELDDAKKELAEGESELADAKKELADAKKKLDDAKPDINKARKTIKNNKGKIKKARAAVKEYQTAVKELKAGRKELKASRKKLDQGWKEYKAGKKEYKANKKKAEKEFAKAQAQLDAVKEQLDQGKKQLKGQKKELDKAKAAYDALKKQTDPLFRRKKSGEKLTAEEKGLIARYREVKKQYQAGNSAYKQAKKQLDAAEKEYKTQKKKFQKEKNAAEKELAAAEKQLAEAEKTLNQGEAEYEAGKKQLEEAAARIEEAKPEIKKAKKAIQEWDKNYPKMKKAIRSYEKGESEYKKGKKEYNKAVAEYEDGLAEYEDGVKEYEDGLAEFKDGKRKYKKNRRKLRDAKEELEDGKQEYLDARQKAEDAFAAAEEKLADAREKIADLSEPEWYILDRNSNVTYVSFTGNADKVSAIARVFPIFFFLVAALVALTTMTRMVEEERQEIGTMKALGYRSSVIARKYLRYAGLAGVLGSITGVLLGQWIFPVILWNAYGIMYYYTGFRTGFIAKYALPSALAAIAAVMASTWWAVSESLKETPARLMQPKAPQEGKRIFLEHIRPVWRRMSFIHKVTARNLFRYKKRFFMTILGISGCTALLVTGFGVRDSIGNIVDIQFQELQRYRLTVALKNDAVDADRRELEEFITARGEEYLPVHTENGDAFVGNAKKKESITIEVPMEAEAFRDYVDLRVRTTGEAIPFNEESVILTEKLADILGVGVGDNFTLENAEDEAADFTVTGITENYLRGYVYLGAEAWRQAYGEAAEISACLVKSPAEGPEAEEAEITDFLTLSGVYTAQFSTSVMETFDNMLDKINYIVVVLIVCAGLLAFVVLYNLTNINISERQREIATIKVLGFFPGEVNSYIFRETFLLSLFGMVAGLVLGIFLHRFVIIQAEVSAIMFGRRIYPLSFLWSALITMLFTILVSLVLSGHLKRIDMVESLKSVD